MEKCKTVNVDKELHRQLKQLSLDTEKTIKELVIEALKEYLNGQSD